MKEFESNTEFTLPLESPTQIAASALSRLSDFWDELAEKTGKGKGLFFEEIFGPMWRDGNVGAKHEEELNNWSQQSEEMQPFALMAAALTACAYAAETMRTEKNGNLGEAWRLASKTSYWLGITIGAWSIRSDQEQSIGAVARLGAAARHVENRAMKADVFTWLDANMPNFNSMDSAAEEISRKVVPTKFRTARDWVGEWKKLRAAGTP